MEKIIATPYVKLWMEEDIICGEYAEKLEINLEIAKQCVGSRIAFSKETNRLCLFDIRGLKYVDKAARDYLGKEGTQYIKAGALIVRSPLTKTLANLFLMINKPQVPTKLFTNKKDAKEWLLMYL